MAETGAAGIPKRNPREGLCHTWGDNVVSLRTAEPNRHARNKSVVRWRPSPQNGFELIAEYLGSDQRSLFQQCDFVKSYLLIYTYKIHVYNHRSWVVIRILYVQQVPLKIFPGGVKNNFATVVIHPTACDGCVELAAISLGMWACGWSMVEAQFKAAKDHVKNHLLQDWSFKVQGLVTKRFDHMSKLFHVFVIECVLCQTF